MTLPTPSNNARLEALKDIHQGKRAFLLGNGPSLRLADLDLLKDEITFASNKIYLAFPEVEWRPTYLTACDAIVARNIKKELASLHDITRIFGASVSKEFAEYADEITFVNWPTPEGDRTWDPICGFRCGHSVVNLDIKLAHWMGCNPLYVIGLDFSFKVPQTETGEVVFDNKVIVSEGELNHFHKDYRPAGETWTVPRLDRQEEEFRIAKQFLSERGVSIYNASRSTKLETWPRVDFDSLFAK